MQIPVANIAQQLADIAQQVEREMPANRGFVAVLPVGRSPLGRHLDGIAHLAGNHRSTDNSVQDILTSVREIAAHNRDIINRTRHNPGYRNFPDYGQIGEMLADIELLGFLDGHVKGKSPLQLRLMNIRESVTGFPARFSSQDKKATLGTGAAIGAMTAATAIDTRDNSNTPYSAGINTASVFALGVSLGLARLDHGVSGKAVVNNLLAAGMVANTTAFYADYRHHHHENPDLTGWDHLVDQFVGNKEPQSPARGNVR